jgi:hypothetical protein
VTPSGKEAVKRLAREIATYRRELPRLLDEGQTGRHVLIKGDDLTVWDTSGDALQAGRLRFGPDEPIFVKTIDPRDPEHYTLIAEWMKSECLS